MKTRSDEEQRRDLEQSDLEHRPYRFWDDQWNDDYNYEKHAESD